VNEEVTEHHYQHEEKATLIPIKHKERQTWQKWKETKGHQYRMEIKM